LKHESTSLAERHKFFHLHAEFVFKVDERKGKEIKIVEVR
jgi:hypothetical protein